TRPFPTLSRSRAPRGLQGHSTSAATPSFSPTSGRPEVTHDFIPPATLTASTTPAAFNQAVARADLPPVRQTTYTGRSSANSVSSAARDGRSPRGQWTAEGA